MTQFPHCDSRVLHAPKVCEFCDLHPEWQELREAWGIAFTGQSPPSTRIPGSAGTYFNYETTLMNTTNYVGAILPCPADFNRPPNAENDHRAWGGNRASSPAIQLFRGARERLKGILEDLR